MKSALGRAPYQSSSPEAEAAFRKGYEAINWGTPADPDLAEIEERILRTVKGLDKK